MSAGSTTTTAASVSYHSKTELLAVLRPALMDVICVLPLIELIAEYAQFVRGRMRTIQIPIKSGSGYPLALTLHPARSSHKLDPKSAKSADCERELESADDEWVLITTSKQLYRYWPHRSGHD